MDEWDPKLGWLIGGGALLLTALIVVLSWPRLAESLASAAPAPQAAAPAAEGAPPPITESRAVGPSRVHRID